jgi:hypothetical protein
MVWLNLGHASHPSLAALSDEDQSVFSLGMWTCSWVPFVMASSCAFQKNLVN